MIHALAPDRSDQPFRQSRLPRRARRDGRVTNTLAASDEARTRQAFLNMKGIAESEGAMLQDAVRFVVYFTVSLPSTHESGADRALGQRAIYAPRMKL